MIFDVIFHSFLQAFYRQETIVNRQSASGTGVVASPQFQKIDICDFIVFQFFQNFYDIVNLIYG